MAELGTARGRSRLPRAGRAGVSRACCVSRGAARSPQRDEVHERGPRHGRTRWLRSGRAGGGSHSGSARARGNHPGTAEFLQHRRVCCKAIATGVVVKHHMGRPIKVEGNPQHPASLGATDVFAQAEVLDFYDPERSFGIRLKGDPTSRAALDAALAAQKEAIAANHGAGFCILTGAISSPTLIAQIQALLKAYPKTRWRQFEPVSRGNVARGAALAYGPSARALFKLDAADVILAIDSDLLSSAPGHLRYARDFAARRNPTRTARMSRVYAIEPTPTLIGAAADHRFIAGPRDLPGIVAALADAVLRNRQEL